MGLNPLYSPLYGGQVMQGGSIKDLPPMPAPGLNMNGPAGNGVVMTYEKPILEFFPDIVVGNNANILLLAGKDLPRQCVALRVIDLLPGVAGVYCSINGGGPKKLLDRDSFSNVLIRSIQITTDATGSCTIQPFGTGE